MDCGTNFFFGSALEGATEEEEREEEARAEGAFFLTVGVKDFVVFVWVVFLSDTGDTTSMMWSSSLFLFLDFGLVSVEEEEEAAADEEASERAGGAADDDEEVDEEEPGVTVVDGVVTTSPFLAAL